jgi:hypothetical protein
MRYISNEARTLSAIGFMAAILSVAPCSAEPQHYSETIDFSDTPARPTTLSTPLGLGTNTWNNLGGTITTSTNTITIYDDIAGVDQRFYRIVPPDATP